MNTIAAFARDSLILCARYRHLAPLCTTADHWFSHLAVSYDRFAQLLHVRPQSAIHLRLCIGNTRRFNSLCPLLDLWIQLLLGLVLRVLMYLSLLLTVAVANELATLGCVSLAISASQERKQRGTVYEILLESNSTLLLSELALFCRKTVFVHVPGQRLSA